jgi:hypothetical protein
MRSESLARRLVRWFPLSWRVRYEDEFVALLEAAPQGWRTTMDVVQGWVSEWGHALSVRLARAMNATGRFAGGVRLVLLVLLAVALGVPIFMLGNAICSLAAIELLQRGWTLPAGVGTLAYLVGLVLTLMAIYRRRNPPLGTVPPGILALGIFLAGVTSRMDPSTHTHYALLSFSDLMTYMPGASFGYLVPDALWFRRAGLRTRPEPAPATLGLTVLGLSGATKS